jgi:hypothetical protein
MMVKFPAESVIDPDDVLRRTEVSSCPRSVLVPVTTSQYPVGPLPGVGVESTASPGRDNWSSVRAEP